MESDSICCLRQEGLSNRSSFLLSPCLRPPPGLSPKPPSHYAVGASGQKDVLDMVWLRKSPWHSTSIGLRVVASLQPPRRDSIEPRRALFNVQDAEGTEQTE